MAKKATSKAKSKSPQTPKKVEETAVTILPAEERQESVELTPRQALFLQLYYDHHSPTWGNAKQSALKAGFSESMANQITYLKPQWFVDFCRQNSLINKIEAHFQEVMELPNITQAMGAFGPLERTEVVQEEVGVYKTGKKKGQTKYKKVKIKTPIFVPNVQVIKAKNEVAKIAAPAHDPDRYGRKQGGGNKFIFNMAPDRERFA